MSEKWVEFHAVESDSRKGVFYTVARASDGSWGCSCPRWIYHREVCKHIRRVADTSYTQKIFFELDEVPEPARVQVQKAISRFALID